ncbi:MAG: hypothetical protein DAHOPDDO_00843 [Ignavibacteriaceae bacterium]|nr:hypothetical protein [Ignavibacteriaceae bacterium]
MKTIIIFLSLIFFTSLSLPQFQHKELLSIDAKNQGNVKVHDISCDGYLIMSEIIGDFAEYYLGNIKNISDKKLIFSSTDCKNDFINFSTGGNLIVYKTKLNNKIGLQIYDIEKQSSFDLTQPNGDIVSASIVNEEILLYQLRQKESLPEIYKYSRSNNTSTFLTYGMGETISPNGKWFFVKKYNTEINSLKDKLIEGKISKEEFSDRIINAQKTIPKSCIYDINGKLLLELQEFNNQIVEVNWSSDSKKLVVREIGDLGFYIIRLNTESGMRIEKIYHFNGISSTGGFQNFALNPIWSPDGTKILFINSIEDGHEIIRMDLWIIEDNVYNLYSALIGVENSISRTVWKSNKIINYIETDNTNTFYKINELIEKEVKLK